MNLLVSRWSVSFEFSFCGGKTRSTHAFAANKRANSHNLKIKKLNLITITFLAVYLTVLAKLLSLFFKSVHALLFFLKRSLIDGCQTVTDAFKDFKSLFGSLLNHLYHYANENVSVKHLSLICIISIVTTIYLLKDFSFYRRYCRIYSPRSFGFFRKEFR